MSALTLTRCDPSRNMARFYRLDVQPDLFGQWTLWREWGRIGRGGQVRMDTFATADQAATALDKMRRAKVRRGYQAHGMAA
jgi:predicted DNA-binding WGR domain protein